MIDEPMQQAAMSVRRFTLRAFRALLKTSSRHRLSSASTHAVQSRPMADRAEFERRLLALARDYLDFADEKHPDGFEIEDFMLLYLVRVAPGSDEELQPWHGGDYPGWWRKVGASSSTGSFWQDEAMLDAALSAARDQRFESELQDSQREDEYGDSA